MREQLINGQLAIGVDVGATKIAAALVTPQGEILSEERIATSPTAGVAMAGVDAVIERLGVLVTRLLAQAPQPVAGIGIGAPGYVDSPAGIVRNAVNLGWVEVAIVAQVTAYVAEHAQQQLPVWVENDANVHALGEYTFGAAQGMATFVNVAIGSGLGSGVIVNGQLVPGATYSAAEMGHLSFDPIHGRPCACGLRGCIETVVSGPGLVRSVRELAVPGQTSSSLTDLLSVPHTGLDALTGERVVEAARAGDNLALAAMALTAQWLGLAFGAYVAVLNPAAIVVGGGVGMGAFDLLIPGALAELARRTLPQSYRQLQVLPAQVTSATVGASALVWHGLGATTIAK